MTPDFESAFSNVPTAETFAETLRKRLAENHNKAAKVIHDVASKLGETLKSFSPKSTREVRIGLQDYELNEDPLNIVLAAFSSKGYKVEHVTPGPESEASEELILRW